MKADVKTIGKVLTGDEKFFIPSYQRPYCWGQDDAEDLARDVYDSCQSSQPNEEEYFIGSLICIPHKLKDGLSYEVVDGQQRLVTLTLIIQQMKKHIESKKAQNELERMIFHGDSFEDHSSPVPTLKVRRSERDFYLSRVLQGNDRYEAKTPPQKAFAANQKRIGDFLLEQTKGEQAQKNLMKLAKYLREKVSVVFVEADTLASSFRLFNVLNNRGIPLSDADLTKNLLLEKVSGDQDASEQVERNWATMESLVGGENLEMFLYIHKISERKGLKESRAQSEKKIYDYYTDMLSKKFGSDSVRMSDALLRSTEHYQAILESDFKDDSVKKSLRFLQQVAPKKKSDEWMPAFLAFLNSKHDQGKFSELVSLFEKVYMHSQCMRLARNYRRRKASYLATEAVNDGDSINDIMAGVRELAKNDEFERSLDNDFYDGTGDLSNLTKAILLRLERESYDDSADTYYPLRKISVEHILPRDREDAYWKKRFKAKDKPEEWLNRLGNLTIISASKNSSARNLGFDRKKGAYQKSKKCPFGITNQLCDLPEWNPKALQKRHEELKACIMQLWWVETPLL